MKLSHLEKVLENKLPPSNGISFEDFLDVLSSVVRDEEESLGSQQPYSRGSTVFQVSRGNVHLSCHFLVLLTWLYLVQVGDKVELIEGYERFGDASNGPLHPGERGTVIDLQEGPSGDRYAPNRANPSIYNFQSTF
jgi:hypothetical protein